jgi:REP element-mobilizing transposase RayT
VLKLAGSPEAGAAGGFDRPPERRRKESSLKLFHSEKIKYERALALQKLNRDPDGVYVQLKFHLLWNVSHRIPVFKPAENFFDVVHYIFAQSSEQVDGLVDLLHLAPDHIHLYVESGGEFSIEEIANRVKRFTGNAVPEKFPVISERLGENAEIWDEAYFVESIG